jgi:phage/conjugal plasmid C-4 type zinc finger TraR family protein
LTENEFEMATQLAERDRADAIAAARRTVDAEGSAECEDCECTIPHARRLAAPFATRCIECQEAHELARQHYFHRFF